MESLLRKFIQGTCTPEETEQVVQFFQQSEDADVAFMPTEDEVLELLKTTHRIKEDSAKRIYRNITRIPARKGRRRSLFGRTGTRLAAAALFAGVISGSWFLGQRFQDSNLSAAPSEGFVTLISENGNQTLLTDSDSLQISDSKGAVVGYQKGSSIVYAPAKERASLQYNTITVPYGKRFELSLSDGTRVHLNAGTSIKFPVAFVNGKQREVFLKGEAFFEVARDEKHPFIVNTDDLDIEVLGTQFNVSAYGNSELEQVVLLEGSVKVKNEAQEVLILNPDQMASSNGKWLHKSSVTAADRISWKDGYLTLNKNTSTVEAIALLERYYHINIHSEGEQDPEKIVGSGKIFLSDKVENVITTLSLLTSNTYSFKYSQSPNKL